MQKKLAVVVGALSAVYMFIPEPTDAIPFLGWLDEGMAGGLLLWSLKTLELTPSNLLARLKGKPVGTAAPSLAGKATAAGTASVADDLGAALDAQLNARLQKMKASV